MFKRILFATDFSPHAEVAKKVATCLAQRDDDRLWALTVLEPIEEPLIGVEEPPVIPSAQWEEALEAEEKELEREEEHRLSQDVAEIETAGVNVTKLVREGDPDREIIAAAQEMEADLIVMGSHSRRTIWDVVLGSTTAKVAKTAPCPVLIVSHLPPHRGAKTPKRLLFATDFSPHAKATEKVALSLAKEHGEQQQLWVLTVIEPGNEIPMPLGSAANAPDQTAEAVVDKWLDTIVADAQAYGVQAEKIVRHGHIVKEILKAAIDVEADMIIMGAHSRRHIWEVMMGSTVESVSKEASIPVLIVCTCAASKPEDQA